MKRIKFVLFLLLVLVYSACWNHENSREYQEYRQELLRIRQNLKQHKSIAGESKMDSLLYYFDKEGTEADRFMAHFCYAHYLNDASIHGSAYKEFVKVLSLSPARKSNEDDDMLRSAYSHLQILSRADNNYEIACRWCSEAQDSKIFSQPYLHFLYYDKACNYLGKGQDDSCNVYLQRAYNNLLVIRDWTPNDCWCLDQITARYALMGQTDKFNTCLDLLKKHPYDGYGRCSDLYAGFFYAQRGCRDSADFYFRKSLNASVDEAYQAALQLGISFRNRHEHDSVFAYFQKTVTLSEKFLQEREDSYTREQEVTKRVFEKEMKIMEQRNYLLVFALACVLCVLLFVFCYMGVLSLRRHRDLAEKKLIEVEEKRRGLELQLEKVLEEYRLFQEKKHLDEYQSLMQRFNKLIVDLELMASQKKSADQSICSELLQTFFSIHSAIYDGMKATYPRIKSTDVLICILASSGFSTSQIAVLLDYESPEIYHFMQRISKGLTGKSVGRITEFRDVVDKFIEEHATVLAES